MSKTSQKLNFPHNKDNFYLACVTKATNTSANLHAKSAPLMNKKILLLCFLFLSATAYAQVNINSLPATITQDFNSLATSGTSNTWSDNTTLTGWYSTRTEYRASDGSSTAGALYSFGTGTASDRALGSIASGTTGSIFFGIRLKNNTTQTITSLQITYTGEQWRNGGRTDDDSLHFSYQIGATVSSLTSGTWTTDDDLSFVGPIKASTANALDGNASANRTTKNKTLNVSIGPSQEIMLRWTDFNSPGGGQYQSGVADSGSAV
jgi:hypothetical protein